MRLINTLVCLSVALSMSACAGRKVGQEQATKQPDSPQEVEVSKKKPPSGDNAEATAEYHFSLAQAYVAEGNPDRAIEEFKVVLSYDPHSALVYTRLATEYIKKGSFTNAMEACKEALQRDPKYIDARLILAGLLSTSRENEAALKEYDAILAIDPTHEEAMVYKAQVLIEDGKLTEASRALKKYLTKTQDSALAWYYLGRSEQKLEHFSDAINAFNKAMELRPGFSQAGLALGYLFEYRNQNDKAIAVYKTLYDRSQDLGAANRLATIYLKSEKYDLAVTYLEAVQAGDPEDLNARVKLGLVQMELKNYSGAISTFKALLEKNPESDRIHYYLGSLYEETKQTALAISELKKIEPDSKLYVDSSLHVAFLLKQEDKIEEARIWIKDSIRKSPKTANFYLFAASIEEDTKNISTAVSILEEGAKNVPGDEKIHYFLGSLYDRQGLTDKSLVQMEGILNINPDNVDALNYIGYTWTVQGVRLNDAESLLKRALHLKPNNGYVQDSWGWYLFVRGRLRESVVELEKAARLKPTEATILEHLGDAYVRSNLREKAVKQYEDAIRFAEDDTLKTKLQDKLSQLRQEIVKGGRTNANGAPRQPASN